MAYRPNREEPQGLKERRAMNKKNRGRAPVQNPTPKTTDSQNYKGMDSMIGWVNLAKPLRNRQQKRGWQRGTRK